MTPGSLGGDSTPADSAALDPEAREYDAAQTFTLESSGIRGNLVRLGDALDEIVSRHDYPVPLAALIGEMLALTVMQSNLMKYDGVFTLQTKGDGPVKMMVADATSKGHLRGYAGFEAETLAAALAGRGAADQAEPFAIADILGKGYLAFTVDQGAHTERYQGIVELTGQSLSDCLQHYFKQSEQIRCGLIVAAARIDGAWRAGGLILQRVPDQGGTARKSHEDLSGAPQEEADEAEDWHRSMILQASCTPGELLDWTLPINDLLFRLFHEEGVRVFRRRALTARCRCSRTRLEETLRSLPRAEVEDFKDGNEIVMSCQFCNQEYRFDAAALNRIYAS